MKPTTVLLVLAALTVANATLAASPLLPPRLDHERVNRTWKPASPVPDFAALDADRDGRLSRAEFAKHPMAAHFGMLDANPDESLTRAEFAAVKGM